MPNKLGSEKHYQLWTLLHQVTFAIHKSRERELMKHDVTPIQCYVMFVIDSLGGKATPGKITNWSFREPHSVSSLLKAMEKKGLINKSKIKAGNNQITVTLTPKGRAIFKKVDDIKSIKESLSILSEEEHDQLRAILIKLREKVLITLANQRKLPFP